ncbi:MULTISPECIES: hypothetical protein [Paraburkholderia]|uniref:hypothetical protein n=1 Tax=Paraburkholderia TaxID=1822464 RepID=UPI0038B72C2F
MARFYGPAFRTEAGSLARLEAIAWDAYSNARKSPVTDKPGEGFEDPDYDLSAEWRAASDRIKAAQPGQQDRASRPRILIVNASSRNDNTCPGEMSKSFRLGKLAQEAGERKSREVDFLDLSRLNSDHDLHTIPARVVCRQRCRVAIGHAVAPAGGDLSNVALCSN